MFVRFMNRIALIAAVFSFLSSLVVFGFAVYMGQHGYEHAAWAVISLFGIGWFWTLLSYESDDESVNEPDPVEKMDGPGDQQEFQYIVDDAAFVHDDIHITGEDLFNKFKVNLCHDTIPYGEGRYRWVADNDLFTLSDRTKFWSKMPDDAHQHAKLRKQ